jgi:hypothetical protein
MLVEMRNTWSGSLHQTFRLLPAPSTHLRPFLESDNLTAQEILPKLPYDSARARAPGQIADSKRYRDGRLMYETIGLLYEDDEGVLHVTSLGIATLRWLDLINAKNFVILAKNAAYALSACQLRNPVGMGRQYHESVNVFPFAFIWRAMLALEGRISSDELNRAIFKVTNEDELIAAVAKITEARSKKDITVMGNETISGAKKDDRIIPWTSLASFGWTLFSDKSKGGGYYEIFPSTKPIVREASRIQHKWREFRSAKTYVEHIANAAALPMDMR